MKIKCPSCGDHLLVAVTKAGKVRGKKRMDRFPYPWLEKPEYAGKGFEYVWKEDPQYMYDAAQRVYGVLKENLDKFITEKSLDLEEDREDREKGLASKIKSLLR